MTGTLLLCRTALGAGQNPAHAGMHKLCHLVTDTDGQAKLMSGYERAYRVSNWLACLTICTQDLCLPKGSCLSAQDCACACRVGVDMPTVEVRCENLTMEAKVTVGSRALPTVLNSYRNFFEASVIHYGWCCPLPKQCHTRRVTCLHSQTCVSILSQQMPRHAVLQTASCL